MPINGGHLGNARVNEILDVILSCVLNASFANT